MDTTHGIRHDAASARTLRVRTDDGIFLACSVWDGEAGIEPIVCIPGLGSARHVYLPLIAALPASVPVISFDPRGVGESDVPDAGYSMARLARDVHAVIAELADRTVTVFGASMGGMVAQHVALSDAAQRVSHLILVATTPGGSHATPPVQWAFDRLMGKGARDPGDAYRIACTVLYSEEFQIRGEAFIAGEVAYRGKHPVPGRTFLAQRHAIAEHDTYNELPSIHIPTLVLHGMDDVVQPAVNGALLARLIPQAVFEEFPHAGHLVFHEDPEGVARSISAFMAQYP